MAEILSGTYPFYDPVNTGIAMQMSSCIIISLFLSDSLTLHLALNFVSPKAKGQEMKLHLG